MTTDLGELERLARRVRWYRPTNEWGDPVHHMICDEAADAIESLSARLRAAEGALTEIARLDTDMRADFSVGARQSQIARSALPHPVGEGT